MISTRWFFRYSVMLRLNTCDLVKSCRSQMISTVANKPCGNRNAVEELGLVDFNEHSPFLEKTIEHIYRFFSLSWNVARRKLDGEILTSTVLIEPTSDVAGDFVGLAFGELFHQSRNGVSLGFHGALEIR